MERLTDPEQEEAYQAKGLVVGYVQSGKTANFTGVVAKAIDAGYRLVIVLTGTMNLLRAQTQRRIDMELVGQENIRAARPGGAGSSGSTTTTTPTGTTVRQPRRPPVRAGLRSTSTG